MANIIDKTYFEGGELNIAGTEQTAVEDNLNLFIAKYENDYLQKALGYHLWKLFNADAYPTPATQRFKDLLNGGVEWTDSNNHVHLWTGLNDLKLSPIAMYIWYWFQRYNATYSSVQGEVSSITENAKNVSVQTKQMRAYNEMSNVTCQLWGYLKHAKTGNALTFPEFDICQAHHFGKMDLLNI